jgi:hypothetical protein
MIKEIRQHGRNLPSPLNVLFYGPIAQGKTAIINTLLTAFDLKVLEPLRIGRSAPHDDDVSLTPRLHYYPIPGTNINLVDCEGRKAPNGDTSGGVRSTTSLYNDSKLTDILEGHNEKGVIDVARRIHVVIGVLDGTTCTRPEQGREARLLHNITDVVHRSGMSMIMHWHSDILLL